MLSVIVGLTCVLGLFYGGYFLLCNKYNVRRSAARKDYAFQPTVSLVIATYNEEEIIARKLENTFSLDYPMEKMEVLVIDASTDKTSEIASRYSELYPNLRLIKEDKRRGLAHALNLGYRAARNEIVIKSDCDILLAKNAVREIVANFADPCVGAVSGAQELLVKNATDEGYRMLFEKARIAESWIDSTHFFQPFSAFRKDLISSINGRSMADDSELALKIRKKNYKTLYDPDAVFFEQTPSSFLARRQQKDRRAQGHIKLVLQHLDVAFNPKYKLFGLVVFPINFFMLVVGPYLFLLLTFLSFLYLYLTFGTTFLILIFSLLTSTIFLIRLGSGLKFLRPIFGFIDAQISLIDGGIRLLLSPQSYIWNKAQR